MEEVSPPLPPPPGGGDSPYMCRDKKDHRPEAELRAVYDAPAVNDDDCDDASGGGEVC